MYIFPTTNYVLKCINGLYLTDDYFHTPLLDNAMFISNFEYAQKLAERYECKVYKIKEVEVE